MGSRRAADLAADPPVHQDVPWSTLKLYLERQGHECGGPRPTLKKAFAENLIPTPEDADVWFRMLEDRHLTSHADDEALAGCIDQHIRSDYAPLLSGMADQIQTLTWERTRAPLREAE